MGKAGRQKVVQYARTETELSFEFTKPSSELNTMNQTKNHKEIMSNLLPCSKHPFPQGK